MKCPFSQSLGGMKGSENSFHTMDSESLLSNSFEHKIDIHGNANGNGNGENKMAIRRKSVENLKKLAFGDKPKNNGLYEHGLPSSKVRSVFPYHVVSR
jgi:hypothetical protein